MKFAENVQLTEEEAFKNKKELDKVVHIPALKDQLIDTLNIKKDGVYVDCTFGSGGHSKEIISMLNEKGKLVSFDCDHESLVRCSEDIAIMKNFSLINDDFSNFVFHLERMKINLVDGFIFDLGLSSEQIASNRGFSYRNEDDFLDMRFNRSNSITASEIINKSSEKDLADIFFFYGQEKFSRRIAKKVCKFRKKEPIKKVSQLVSIITSCLPSKKTRLKHPAKKIFQSLRIAVNDELNKLENSIMKASEFLSDNSSLVIISYHSLEDRVVKKTFKFLSESQNNCFLYSKKPIVATKKELELNNRARSAKMRILSRVVKSTLF